MHAHSHLKLQSIISKRRCELVKQASHSIHAFAGKFDHPSGMIRLCYRYPSCTHVAVSDRSKGTGKW